MKYLYPYEQTHERLSTSGQLQQAIETNKRESRQKPSPQMMGVAYSASRDNQAALGMNTLSLGLTGPINPSGSQQTRSPHILMPNGGQHPQHLPQMPNGMLIMIFMLQRGKRLVYGQERASYILVLCLFNFIITHTKRKHISYIN